MNAPPLRIRRAGVTLIEIMVAIAIFSLIGTMVYSALSTTSRHKQRIEADLDRHEAVAAALSRIARELSMAYVSAQRNTNASLVTMETAFHGKDHGQRDRLDFTSFGHQRLFRNAHESDQNEVSYFITRHPEDSSRTVLARREQNRPDDNAERGGNVEILLEDVTVFDLEYLEPVSARWVREWDARSAADHLNVLPEQVKIIVEVPDPRNPRETIRLGTRASLPIRYGLNHALYQ